MYYIKNVKMKSTLLISTYIDVDTACIIQGTLSHGCIYWAW